MSSEELGFEDSEIPTASEVAPETSSGDSDTTEWVDGMDPLDLLTEEELNSLLSAGGGRDYQNKDNQNGQVTIKPSPRNPSGDSNYSEGGSSVNDIQDCYGQYADACKAGFIAPTIEYAGYLSCQKLEDGTVALKGLVKLVGGNYKDFSWNGQTHNGMGIVANRVSEWPYVISWADASATFWSMDDRYQGIIGEAGGHGSVLLDDSQIDPSCRF